MLIFLDVGLHLYIFNAARDVDMVMTIEAEAMS